MATLDGGEDFVSTYVKGSFVAPPARGPVPKPWDFFVNLNDAYSVELLRTKGQPSATVLDAFIKRMLFRARWRHRLRTPRALYRWAQDGLYSGWVRVKNAVDKAKAPK